MTAATPASARGRRLGVALGAVVLGADVLVQAGLAVLGFQFIADDGDPDAGVGLLLLWCAFGTLYLVAAVIVLGVSVRMPRLPRSPALDAMEDNLLTRIVLSCATFLASIVGITSAVLLLVLRNDPDWSGFIDLIAVWAMLLSWALFHWGYARIYARRHRRSAEPPLLFPRTEDPRLVDFVYFAFTNGTAFSVSDVSVASTRMRWTVVWHTTFSFFFNALIIVLAVNTLTGGNLLGLLEE